MTAKVSALVRHASYDNYSEPTAVLCGLGSWLPPRVQQPVIDRHMLFVLYTAQSTPAMTFFPWCSRPPTTMNGGSGGLKPRTRATTEPVAGRAFPGNGWPPRFSPPAALPVRPIVPATP